MKANQAESKAQRKAEHEARLAAERAKAAVGSDGAPSVEKSKAQLKAERRAQQEAQRAAKAAAAGDNNSNNNKTAATKENKSPQNSQTSSSQNASKKQPDNGQQTPKPSQPQNQPLDGSNNHLSPTSATVSKSQTHSSPEKSPEKELSKSGVIYSKMFAHLPTRPSDLTNISINGIPPRIVEVGYRINQNYYKGSTMKCVAILTAFQEIVREYELKNADKRDLKHELQNLLFHDCHRFLSACCPISIAMENAMKHLKVSFTKLEDGDDAKLKEDIIKMIGQFVEEDMIQACEAIIRKMQSKINDDDVIMTLGYSTMLRNAFILAWKNGRRFRVVAVDTRPNCEGKEMAEALINAGIPVTYCLVSAISYIIHTVTRVFVEAHALMGNGYVMSHSGAALIALVAHSANVQFLVCCETYKFSERVHTDSFVHNELGSEEAFFKSIPADKRPPIDGLPALHVMDMLYDLTPHEFVTTIVTEKSLMPATSVPIILRIRESK